MCGCPTRLDKALANDQRQPSGDRHQPGLRDECSILVVPVHDAENYTTYTMSRELEGNRGTFLHENHKRSDGCALKYYIPEAGSILQFSKISCPKEHTTVIALVRTIEAKFVWAGYGPLCVQVS